MKHIAHGLSQYHAWRTPPDLFADLHAEFDFTLDAAASPENALLPAYLTVEQDALTQPWTGRVFCNPPYGTGIGTWVRKAHEEAERGALVVMLIPARTDTAWWHDYVMDASEVRLIRGRLRFHDGPKANPLSHNAPFPSCVVVFSPGNTDPRRIWAINRDGSSTYPLSFEVAS